MGACRDGSRRYRATARRRQADVIETAVRLGDDLRCQNVPSGGDGDGPIGALDTRQGDRVRFGDNDLAGRAGGQVERDDIRVERDSTRGTGRQNIGRDLAVCLQNGRSRSQIYVALAARGDGTAGDGH